MAVRQRPIVGYRRHPITGGAIPVFGDAPLESASGTVPTMQARNTTSDLVGMKRTSPLDIAVPYDLKPGPGAAGQILPQRVEIYDPRQFPIPGSQNFNVSASKSTSSVQSGVDIGLTFTIPNGNQGVLNAFNILVNNMLLTTNVTFYLLVNGAPVPGFGVSILPRVAPSVGNQFVPNVDVAPGSVITVSFTNTDGGSYQLGASVGGWFWPQNIGRLWLANGLAPSGAQNPGGQSVIAGDGTAGPSWEELAQGRGQR